MTRRLTAPRSEPSSGFYGRLRWCASDGFFFAPPRSVTLSPFVSGSLRLCSERNFILTSGTFFEGSGRVSEFWRHSWESNGSAAPVGILCHLRAGRASFAGRLIL